MVTLKPTQDRFVAGRLERSTTSFFGCALGVLAVYIFIFDAFFSALYFFLPANSAIFAFGGETIDLIACALSAVAGVVLTVLAERNYLRQANRERLSYWSRAIIRYCLVYILLIYGFAKVFGNQFYSWASTLDTPLGDISGIQLTWRFFGYSYFYTLFVASAQIVGAMLLFFRRTTTLGALALFPVVLNIVIINFTHEIPVKLYSNFYLVMLAYLIFLDYRKLLPVVGLSASSTAPVLPQFSKRRLIAAIKGVVIISMLFFTVFSNYYQHASDAKVSTPLHGVWEVRDFQRNDERLAAGSDPAVWEKFYVEADSIVAIKNGKPRPKVYYATIDAQQNSILLEDLRSEEVFLEGAYDLRGEGELVVTGSSGDDTISVTLKKAR